MQILDRLSEENKTAKRQQQNYLIQDLFPVPERNYTAPRLTELEKMGYVEETGKKKCEYTGKAVTVYKITQEGYEAVNYSIFQEQIRG